MVEAHNINLLGVVVELGLNIKKGILCRYKRLLFEPNSIIL